MLAHDELLNLLSLNNELLTIKEYFNKWFWRLNIHRPKKKIALSKLVQNELKDLQVKHKL